MPDSRKVYVVDDDPNITALAEIVLTDAGCAVETFSSSTRALAEIIDRPPDILVLDIMMPELDGMELCKKLRERPELDSMVIIICSVKTYEFDRLRAFQLGADGFVAKPIEASLFVGQVDAIANRAVTVKFWGVHGTLPVPGSATVHYGGNTSCVSVELPRDRLFIFDAGTGIKKLSDSLANRAKTSVSGKIFITHPHWDHINALPFFAPLYKAGNEFEISGPAQGDRGMHELIARQMDDVYFPITMKEFSARISFNDLREGTHLFDGVEVCAMLLTHPGYCLGYRVNYNGFSVAYITDNELYPKSSPTYSEHDRTRLIDFVRNVDVLITDSTYFDHEYETKRNWGHSCIGEVASFAHQAAAKRLCLFHHDPAHTDEEVDKKLDVVQRLLADLGSDTVCIAPKEEDEIVLKSSADSIALPSR